MNNASASKRILTAREAAQLFEEKTGMTVVTPPPLYEGKVILDIPTQLLSSFFSLQYDRLNAELNKENQIAFPFLNGTNVIWTKDGNLLAAYTTAQEQAQLLREQPQWRGSKLVKDEPNLNQKYYFITIPGVYTAADLEEVEHILKTKYQYDEPTIAITVTSQKGDLGLRIVFSTDDLPDALIDKTTGKAIREIKISGYRYPKVIYHKFVEYNNNNAPPSAIKRRQQRKQRKQSKKSKEVDLTQEPVPQDAANKPSDAEEKIPDTTDDQEPKEQSEQAPNSSDIDDAPQRSTAQTNSSRADRSQREQQHAQPTTTPRQGNRTVEDTMA